MRCKLNLQFDEWPTHQNPKKSLIFSRKIVLFWKPFSRFCCTLKTANNEPIHFKLAVNHTGDSSIKWPMKVEHFLLHFKEIKYAKKYPLQAPKYQIFQIAHKCRPIFSPSHFFNYMLLSLLFSMII